MSTAKVKKVLEKVKGKVTVRNLYLLYEELQELIKNCQKRESFPSNVELIIDEIKMFIVEGINTNIPLIFEYSIIYNNLEHFVN